MRTTIDLPDSLLREVKIRAAQDGTTLKSLIRRYIEQGLSVPTAEPQESRRHRSTLPVFRTATGKPIGGQSNAELFALLEDEDAARLIGD